MTDALASRGLEASLLARIGADRSLQHAYSESKWASALGAADARWLRAELQSSVDYSLPPRDRVRQARDVLARLRQRLELPEATPRQQERVLRETHKPRKRVDRVAAETEEGDAGRHMIYLLYSAADLLYVGITDRGPTRLAEHWRDKPWFWQVDHVEFERCRSRSDALKREAYLIERLHPLHNVRHNRQRVTPARSTRNPT